MYNHAHKRFIHNTSKTGNKLHAHQNENENDNIHKREHSRQ